MQPGADETTHFKHIRSAPLSISASTPDAIVGLIIVFVVVALAFLLIWPWIPQQSAQSKARAVFQPLAHGQAATHVTLDDSGTPVSWSTESVIAIPAWEIFGDSLSPLLRDHVLAYLPELVTAGDYPPDTSLFRIDTRTLSHEGDVNVNTTYVLRRRDHDEMLAVIFPEIETPFLYQPPIHFRIEELAVEAPHPPTEPIVQSGRLAGTYTYTVSTRQSYLPDVTTPFGTWLNCRQVEADTILDSAAGLIGHEVNTAAYCANTGLVTQAISTVDGPPTTIYTLRNLETANFADIDALLPPRQPLRTTVAPTVTVGTWVLSHHAQATSLDSTASSTIPPAYVPAPQPYLLTAARSGPLLALDATTTHFDRWQFQTGGTIFSPPTVDAATGLIYFGSSDKHLYALTSDGLFVWRFSVPDNIAAQPLLIEESVIIASEDGSIFAVDKTTGREHWRSSMRSSILAAPVALLSSQGMLIIVGDDDGTVTALDFTSGSIRWQTELDGALHAPLAVDGGTVYAGTTEATLHSLNAGGTVLWTADTVSALRTTPALDETSVYVVDSQGWLYALRRTDGQTYWRREQQSFVGPPIRLPTTDALIVASTDGTLSAFAAGGDLTDQWKVADVHLPDGRHLPYFSLGPTFDGSAVWFSDDNRNLFRLGPPLDEP